MYQCQSARCKAMKKVTDYQRKSAIMLSTLLENNSKISIFSTSIIYSTNVLFYFIVLCFQRYHVCLERSLSLNFYFYNSIFRLISKHHRLQVILSLMRCIHIILQHKRNVCWRKAMQTMWFSPQRAFSTKKRTRCCFILKVRVVIKIVVFIINILLLM